MFVSFRWLQRHVNLDGITPEQLCDDLTLSTAEVEGLERFAPHLSDVVVGHVIERAQHPDADKLALCKVDVGMSDPLQIVCGAPNVRQGLKVAVATVGTVLPGGGEPLKIKKSKIRGVESRGMICSVRELELGDEHDGIWELPDEVEVGKPVAAALGMDDWVIEIDNKSLTHRPDLWGHRGIAREIAAIYERELKPLDTSLPETGKAAPVSVKVESNACSRYVALAVDGIEAGAKAPDWMRRLLLAVGQRPIELTVDISNFVMLDLGQPNHLFDRGQLSGGIEVRNAKNGEAMNTLDGEERKLAGDDLLICSAGKPVALAGIMGGEESKVAAGTTSLLLEVATFQPTVVRRTSSRLGLRTDSSARFEKNLDPTLPLQAAGHLCRLLQELQPSVSFPSPVSEAGDWSDPALDIELRPARARSLLGVDLSDDAIAGILRRLEFGVSAKGESFLVSVPSRRATKDVTIEQDLVEEIGRIHRYGNVPERRLLAEIAPPEPDPRREMVRSIQDRLSGAALFHDLISYSYLSDQLCDQLGIADQPHVEIVNPIVEGERRVRRDVTPTLIGLIEKNRRHREDVRLFEVGKGYRPDEANEHGEPREVHQCTLVWARTAAKAERSFDEDLALGLQSVVIDLFDSLSLPAPKFDRAGDDARVWAHPGRALSAALPRLDGQDPHGPAVVLAPLEPGLLRTFGLSGGDLASEVAIAEIDLDALLAAKPAPPGYQPLPRFPGVKVDVALNLDAATEAGAVLAVIEKSGKGLVAETELFDVYTGENVEDGRKSLAFHVLLQSQTKTLTDKESQKFLERLERTVASELGGELRRE